jgi:hypothetical protein
MNEKQAKKIRQLFRKEFRSKADDLAQQQISAIKPKPKYFPMWIWLRLLKIFVRINP